MKLTLKNTPLERKRLGDAFAAFASQEHLSQRISSSILLALEELFTNIISYGFEDALEHEIKAEFTLRSGNLRIRLEDSGRHFDPTAHPTPDITKPLSEKPMGGLGIHMARRSVDDMSYTRKGGRNILLLVKKV